MPRRVPLLDHLTTQPEDSQLAACRSTLPTLPVLPLVSLARRRGCLLCKEMRAQRRCSGGVCVFPLKDVCFLYRLVSLDCPANLKDGTRRICIASTLRGKSPV